MSLSIMEALSVEGLAETHGNGILQLCTTHFDHIDKKIIGMLQENARTPIKEIAKEVYLSSPAVSARISRLEKEGILKGFHAEVNYEAFGYGIKAFINLSVEPYQKKEFYPFIQSVPNVIECNCVTGDYSMLIEVAYQSTVELDHFTVQTDKSDRRMKNGVSLLSLGVSDPGSHFLYSGGWNLFRYVCV